MNEIDRFVQIVGSVESGGDKRAWGDDGFACGRFQDHPSYYCTWGPKREDFSGREMSWDEVFEFAARNYFRAARAKWPHFSLIQIGMYRHLHGDLVAVGWDADYERRWLEVDHDLATP